MGGFPAVPVGGRGKPSSLPNALDEALLKRINVLSFIKSQPPDLVKGSLVLSEAAKP